MRKLTATQRKEHPVTSGVLAYFPDAILEVAHCSFVGNEQHNPGQPLHWAKEKSKDERDAMVRHLMEDTQDPGCLDDDGVRHAAKVAWRALANLQRIIDAELAEDSLIENVEDPRFVAAFDHADIEKVELNPNHLMEHLKRRTQILAEKALTHYGVGEGDASLPETEVAD